jgi:hypothetical protein
MTRRSLLWFVIAAAMLASGMLWWSRRASPAAPVPSASATARGSAAAPPSAPGPGPAAAAAQTRRISPEERKQLGAQIAAAIHKARDARAARARSAGTPVSDDDPVIPLEAVGPELEDALTAAIPLLAHCYEHAGSATPRTAAAQMTMTSDPDLGTVIDTADIHDPAGKTLDHTLDECLRDTIDSLALPPLGQPGKLQIQYSFRFD